MLIDGGRLNQAAAMVHPLITATVGLNRVDVMVVTHYDEDHLQGIRGLLQMNSPVYDNALLFDQGEPGDIPNNNQGPYEERINFRPANREDRYQVYLNAIRQRGNRIRVTASVDSQNRPAVNNNWRNADWLIGKEIFWAEALRFDMDGNYDPDGRYRADRTILPPAQRAGGSWNVNGDPINLFGNVLIPAGAPTVRCIACNQYVQGQANLVGGVGGAADDLKNRKSLIFLLQFNNFKYYIGGDAEIDQEDAATPILNPVGGFGYAGRVHAVKLSHHGASTASSQNFINRLKPKAAFISNGPRNSYGHPHQAVINRLEGFSVHNGTANGLRNYFLSGESDEPANINRPGPAQLNPNIGEVPSDPPPLFPAANYGGGRHAIITVTQAQSNANANGNGVNNFNVRWRDWDAVNNVVAPQNRAI